MVELSYTFEEPTPLTSDTLDSAGRDAVQRLAVAGFAVTLGLARTEVAEVAAIAAQPGVAEYCPEDITRRFGSEEKAEAWMSRGRIVFLLRKMGESAIVGYGWTRPGRYEELPDCDTAFGVRLSSEVAGRGLGSLFTAAIVSGSMAKGMRNIGLETWESNPGAWKTYLKAGAEFGQSKAGKRMTIIKSGRRTRRRQRDDVRMFMRFPQTFRS